MEEKNILHRNESHIPCSREGTRCCEQSGEGCRGRGISEERIQMKNSQKSEYNWLTTSGHICKPAEMKEMQINSRKYMSCLSNVKRLKINIDARKSKFHNFW